MKVKCRLWFALGALACGAPAGAVQWSTEPSLFMRTDYVYNPYLVRNDAQRVYAGRIEVQAPMRAETEAVQGMVTARWSARRYDREKELNGDEMALDLALMAASGSAHWRLNGNAARSSTVTSEWDDTGFVDARKWRTTRAVTPGLDWLWSETTTLSFGGEHTEVKYADAGLTMLVGYSYSGLNAAVAREWSERITGKATLYSSRIEAPRIDNTSDDYGMQLDVKGEMGELWSMSFGLGGHRTHGRLAGASDWQSGGTGTVQATRAGEYGTVNFTVSRSVGPSGFGVLVRRDALAYTQTQALAPRWNTSLTARVQLDTSLTTGRDDANRRWSRVEWRLSHELARNWFLAFGLDYQRQRYESEPDHAQSGTVLVQLGYRAERIALTTDRGAEAVGVAPQPE